MKEHYIRQQMFHTVEQTDDWLEDLDYIEELELSDEQLIMAITTYFLTPIKVMTFPAKSYAVAIIYSLLLQKYFSVPFFESLDDDNLLYGTDKYFVPYHKSKKIYDHVLYNLLNLNKHNILDESIPQIQATIQYFKKEFYISPNPYFNNTTLS